jgi:hypothetical protein
MLAQRAFRGEYRAPNGIFYKVTGDGEPLLLLHGLMVTGAMFDPLVVLLQSNFCMIIPDLRGHGQSGDLSGPYDVSSLTADLDGVLEHAGFENCAVLGYSHGGAVAQQLVRTRRALVNDVDMYLCLQRGNAAGTDGGQQLPDASHAVHSPDARKSGGATIQAQTSRRNRSEQNAGRLATNAHGNQPRPSHARRRPRHGDVR